MPTDVDRAGFRGAGDQAVLAHRIAQRPKSVAVEHGAGPLPVGEDQPGGPIPGLHQAGVVAIEIPYRRIDVEALPGFRHQHRQRLPDVAAPPDQQLECVVEHRRVGAGFVDDGHQQTLVR